MREILFKAKQIDNDEWVEGSLVYDNEAERHYIVTERDLHWGMCCRCEFDGNFTAIKNETICQYTGLTDKNGNKIWENDILSIANKVDVASGRYYFPPIQYPVNVVVKWDFCAWMWETLCKDKRYISFPDAWCHYEAEVIGNIFDNKDLLGAGIK